MTLKRASLCWLLLVCLQLSTGCAAINQPAADQRGLEETHQQERADLERELSLYSD